MGLLETVNNTLGEAKDFVSANQKSVVLGAGAIAAGAVLGASAVAVLSRKKAKRRKKGGSHNKRKRSRKHSGRGARKRRRNGKSRKNSLRRIHRTKTGQPYIILASGKARFIKKSSARSSRRRKGGKY